MSRRFAFFAPNLGGGGAQRVIVNLTRGFLDLGAGVDLVVTDAGGPLRDEVPEEVRLFDLGTGGVMAGLPRLARYLRRERPDAMLSTMSHCNVAAIMARSMSGVRLPLAIREANTLTYRRFRSPSLRERLVFHLMMTLYSRADIVVANSADTASDLVTAGIAGEDEVTVIHNPVVSPALIAKQAETAGHPWMEETGVPVIAGVGRLHPQKDYGTMIRALGILRESREARLVILGEGPERETLLRLIRELRLDESVDMPGFVPNPHPFISKASVLALSSRWEGFGNVLVEALAAGTPVVSTDCPGGPSEILEFGRYGALVPVEDPEAMAEAIAGAIDDPPDPGLLKRRAEDFTIEAVSRLYMDLFDQLDSSLR